MNGSGGTTYHENYFAVTTPVRRRGIHRWISGVTGAILQGNFFCFAPVALLTFLIMSTKLPRVSQVIFMNGFAVGSSQVS